jgi:hypothetical protein
MFPTAPASQASPPDICAAFSKRWPETGNSCTKDPMAPAAFRIPDIQLFERGAPAMRNCASGLTNVGLIQAVNS